VLRSDHEAATARKFKTINKSIQQMGKALKQRLADETDPSAIERIWNEAFRALFNRGFGGLMKPDRGK
jgi:predicted RNA-binding protein (virulence factor B family)